MKEKFLRFMQGRYGVDQFSKALLIAGLVVVLLSSFFDRERSGDAILFPWMGIDHLLLFPGLFQKYIETVCRKSEVSCEDL